MAKAIRIGTVPTVVAAAVEPIIPADTTAATAVLDKPKAPAKGKTKARKEASQTDENTISVLEAVRATGVNLRSQMTSKGDRTIAVTAAINVLIGVGLGEKSKGFGPIIRQVFVTLLKTKLGVKTVKREQITAKALLDVLKIKDFNKQAHAALKTYLAGLKSEDVAEATLKSRGTNTELARRWIDADMAEVYETALKVVCQMGGTAHFDGISMPIDRALGVAFGRSITAAELFRSKDKTVSKAK